jgi:outer membrane protein insertion porin family
MSRENVERLGYFTPGEVIFNTVSPKGKNDILNVDISVKERSTGTITLGAGYGSAQGLFFTGTISEINLLGRGQTISLSAQYSSVQYSKSFNLGFTDPYAFDTRVSMGFDIYSVAFPIPNRYETRKLGFDVRFGYPIADYVNGYLTFKNEGLAVGQDLLLDPITGQDLVLPVLPAYYRESDNGTLRSVILSVVRDKRNNRFETTEGNYQSASLEVAGFMGADKHFAKAVLNNRFYKHIVGDLVFRNSIELGEIAAIGGYPIPPSERFYLGGPNNMKGYNLFLLGPSVSSYPDPNVATQAIPLGGVAESFGLFELEYPLVKDAGLKMVGFYDIGNTWDPFPGFGNLDLRMDIGLGIRWFSPIGPLRFEWGFPLGNRGDPSPVFEFFIGPPF